MFFEIKEQIISVSKKVRGGRKLEISRLDLRKRNDLHNTNIVFLSGMHKKSAVINKIEDLLRK